MAKMYSSHQVFYWLKMNNVSYVGKSPYEIQFFIGLDKYKMYPSTQKFQNITKNYWGKGLLELEALLKFHNIEFKSMFTRTSQNSSKNDSKPSKTSKPKEGITKQKKPSKSFSERFTAIQGNTPKIADEELPWFTD